MPQRTIEQNLLVIERLEEIHKTYKYSLGTMNKSRKWAIWQLQGASLGLAHLAVTHQKDKHDVSLFLLLRLSQEFVNQATYFSNPNTKVEAIRKWWKVYSPLRYSTVLEEVEYTNFKKEKYSHTQGRDLPEGIDFSAGEYTAQLNHLLSLWAHPSYDLTKILFETDKNNGSYELYEFRAPLHLESSVDFAAQQIVNNAARSLHVGSYLYGEPISYSSMITLPK